MKNDLEIEKEIQAKGLTATLVVYLVISGLVANCFMMIDLIEKMSK